jgi:hypothetical protein
VIYRVVNEGSGATPLRREQSERGSAEGMVEAAIGACATEGGAELDDSAMHVESLVELVAAQLPR